MAAPSPTRRSPGFLLLYALANAGGVIAYLPLLTLLLPLKIEGLAGATRIGVLTITVIGGAIAASGSNIAFGWLSDRSVARGGGRRRWLAGGIGATALSFVGIAVATTVPGIVAAIVLFQIAVNAALAPLSAIMADEVPDAQKGIAGGLLAFANPVASGISAVVLGIDALGETNQLAIIWVAIAGLILPLLLIRADPVADVPSPPSRLMRRDLWYAWHARLLMQIAGNVLFLYLLYYFESLDAPVEGLASRIGHLLTIAFIVPLPIAILCGRWSDRTGRRKPFLLGAAILAAAGLAGMAFAGDWASGALSFGVYAVGSAVFLALHSGFAMQLLPDPRHRGRDLGLLNLSNTLPALIGPLLTWLLATPRDFDMLMLALAVLTLAGGGAMMMVRGRR